jgi:hypothetical protein
MNQARNVNREPVEISGTPIRGSRNGLVTITDPLGPEFMAPLDRS